MEKKEFKVFVRDEENFWEILWITQNPKGDFYYAPVDSDFRKLTRHVSGKSHYKGQNSYHPLEFRQPLTDFKGIEQFQFKMVIGPNVIGSTDNNKAP